MFLKSSSFMETIYKFRKLKSNRKVHYIDIYVIYENVRTSVSYICIWLVRCTLVIFVFFSLIF